MPARRLIAVLATCLAVAGAIATSGLLDRDESAPTAAVGSVVKVVDGDTIDVLLGSGLERVRYIGIDTPETKDPRKPVQCFGQRASDFNEQLVGGERVRLVGDVEHRDRYGRLLAYVYRVRDDLFVNAELALLGFARPLTIAPDVRYADRFAALARDAREHRRGLWSAC